MARSSTASGLSAAHRAEARRIIVRGAGLLLRNSGRVHYSQRPDRWEGINKRLLISRGQYPRHADCSSTATWLLWNALAVRFGVRDLVNGAGWRAGYTGTMCRRGKRVYLRRNIKVGDLIFYGRPPTYGHVAIALGGGMCLSHGSEAGPFKTRIDYRPIAQVRRFV